MVFQKYRQKNSRTKIIKLTNFIKQLEIPYHILLQ